MIAALYYHYYIFLFRMLEKFVVVKFYAKTICILKYYFLSFLELKQAQAMMNALQ